MPELNARSSNLETPGLETPGAFLVPLSGPIGPWWAQRPVSESQRECDHPEWRDLKEAGYQCTTCKLIVDDPGEPT